MSTGAVGSGASLGNLERYLWGVTPSLMAWPAVAMGGGPGAFVVAITLGIVFVVDRSFARRRLLPPWYMCAAAQNPGPKTRPAPEPDLALPLLRTRSGHSQLTDSST